MTLQLRKAERKKAKLRIGLGGASGSGKTYSALLLANGMAPWEKIVLIDTENGSGELYSHLGEYNIITITDDYAPEKYIEAIKACEEAGMEVIIIDSITHEWEGKGGCLELHTRAGGNWQDWKNVSPRHQKFVDSIIQSKCHVITTVRKKQDYDMVKDGNGKTKVEKLGMKEVTRDGFEYELTLSFNLSQNNLASVSKDRTNLFMNKPEFRIDQKTGQQLMEWAESGIDVHEKNLEDIAKKEILKLCNDLALTSLTTLSTKEDYEKFVKTNTGLDLKKENYNDIIKELKSKKDAQEFEADLSEDSPAKKLMKDGIKKSQEEK